MESNQACARADIGNHYYLLLYIILSEMKITTSVQSAGALLDRSRDSDRREEIGLELFT